MCSSHAHRVLARHLLALPDLSPINDPNLSTSRLHFIQVTTIVQLLCNFLQESLAVSGLKHWCGGVMVI